MHYSPTRHLLQCLLAVWLWAGFGSAHAQFFACEKLDADQQTQADYCATHVSCRIALAIFKSCADVKDFVKRFYDADRSKAAESTGDGRSEQERVDAMAPADREAGYQRCLSANVQDVCWDKYATTEMRRQKEQAAKDAADKARSTSDRFAADKARQQRITLEVREASIVRRLQAECSPATATSSGCRSVVNDAELIGKQAAALNADAELMKWVPPLVVQSPVIAKPYSEAIDQYLAKLYPDKSTPAQVTATTPANSPRPAGTVALRRGSTGDASQLFSEAITTQQQLGREALAGPGNDNPQVAALNRQIEAARSQCQQGQSQCQARCATSLSSSVMGAFFNRGAGNLQAMQSGSESMQQCTGDCEQARASCDMQTADLTRRRDEALNPALAQANAAAAGASAGGAAAPPPGGSGDFAECQRVASSNTALESRINSIPRNDNNRLLRGAIQGIDWTLQAYRACAADPRAQNTIRSLEAQRASALKTCRQISSVDNCLVSPF